MDLALVCIQPYHVWLNAQLAKLGLIDTNNYDDILIEVDDDNDDDSDNYLKSLDPRNWKEQDHYKIFGLKSKRFFATEEEIKRACECLQIQTTFFINCNKIF
jgi:zuotin related factor